jgi:signal transduction histidine kinase
VLQTRGVLGSRAAWFGWWRFFVAAGGLSLLTMAHLLIAYNNRGVALSPREALFSGIATWFPWALFAPLIFRLCRRFPFDSGTWRRALLVHLPSTALFLLLWTLLRWAASYSSLVDEMPLPFAKLLLWHFDLSLLTYWMIVCIHEAWHNYRRFRERELRASQLEAKLAQAQLEVLKMQLHPHFLFNTLHAISTLIHKDPDAADEMVAQLSDLLRMTLNTIGVQEVTMQQELEFLGRYLDIQKMRFQDRLQVVIDVPADTLDVRVPNQILQPIVENAIRHGVDASSGRGSIRVQARASEHMLQLTVKDDGPGIKPGAEEARKEGRGGVGGIGLANTRARLRELYGPASTLQLTNHPEGGTLVTLTLPLRREETRAATPRPDADTVSARLPSSSASPSSSVPTDAAALARPWDAIPVASDRSRT